MTDILCALLYLENLNMAKAKVKVEPEDDQESEPSLPSGLAVGDEVAYRLPDHWKKYRDDKDDGLTRLAKVTDLCIKDDRPCADLLVFLGSGDGGGNQEFLTVQDAQFSDEEKPGTFTTSFEELASLSDIEKRIADKKKAKADKKKADEEAKAAENEVPHGTKTIPPDLHESMR